MNKKIQVVFVVNILIFFILCSYICNVQAVTQSRSSNIAGIDTSKYPGIKEKIDSLKKEHPNWVFKILYTGISWEDAISYEYTGHRKFA